MYHLTPLISLYFKNCFVYHKNAQSLPFCGPFFKHQTCFFLRKPLLKLRTVTALIVYLCVWL